jgi:hypothetical protein
MERRLANALYSELDEQIDRVLLRSPIHKLRTIIPADALLIFIVVIVLTGSILLFVVATSPSRRLSPNQVQNFIAMGEQSVTLGQKVDFLYQLRMAELAASRGAVSPQFQFTIANIIAVCITLIILGTVIYIYVRLYPTAVFAWGDRAERYASIKNRRAYLWTAIVIGIPIGIGINWMTR